MNEYENVERKSIEGENVENRKVEKNILKKKCRKESEKISKHFSSGKNVGHINIEI